jgi:hypothetical protein
MSNCACGCSSDQQCVCNGHEHGNFIDLASTLTNLTKEFDFGSLLNKFVSNSEAVEKTQVPAIDAEKIVQTISNIDITQILGSLSSFLSAFNAANSDEPKNK